MNESYLKRTKLMFTPFAQKIVVKGGSQLSGARSHPVKLDLLSPVSCLPHITDMQARLTISLWTPQGKV